MDSGRAQRRLPVLGAALADVSKSWGPGGHALAELPGERGQGGRRNAECIPNPLGE